MNGNYLRHLPLPPHHLMAPQDGDCPPDPLPPPYQEKHGVRSEPNKYLVYWISASRFLSRAEAGGVEKHGWWPASHSDPLVSAFHIPVVTDACGHTRSFTRVLGM